MKNKLLKSISATALAIVLGTAALAGTAQAAGGIAAYCDCGCSSTPVEWDEYEEINSESHVHYHYTGEQCNDCGAITNVSETYEIESHDLRAADWPLRYRCADCGYEE